MSTTKPSAEPQSKSPAAPVVAKQPESPEKTSGPQHAVPTTTASSGAASPSPNDPHSLKKLGQPEAGATHRARAMITLQRSIGNNRISNLIGAAVQTKLTVGEADDPHEREADRVAETIIRPETNANVQRQFLMRHPLMPPIQRVAVPKIQRSLKDVDEKLNQFDVPEEELIALLGTLNDAERLTVLAGGYKAQIANALNIGEMVRAVNNLHPALSVKLEWVLAAAGDASDINYPNIQAMVTGASQPERDALKNDLWRNFFVEVCNNKTMITALNDLHFDLATKLEWAKEEISLSYSDIKGFVTSAPQPERDALKNGAWRTFFTDVCTNATMVEAVNDLGFDLGTKLDWMLEEGTDFEKVAGVIRIAPEPELAPVAGDAALMKRLESELSAAHFKTVKEMLTQGLLFSGNVELSEPETGNDYQTGLRHTRSQVTLTKEVHFVEMGTFGPGAFNTLKGRVIAAVTSYLSGKYKVRIASPAGPPKVGDGDYPIIVQVNDNPSSDYEMNLHGGEHGRSSAGESSADIYELGQPSQASILDIQLAHESAHMILGASDEYADAEKPARTLYTDHSLMGDYWTEGVAAAEIKARNFQLLVAHISKYYPDRNISIVR
jgi:hypothetical protein